MTDRDRTVGAAVEALVSAAFAIAGVLLLGPLAIAGFVLLIFGVSGLAHAVLFGLGLVRDPADRDGEEHKRR